MVKAMSTSEEYRNRAKAMKRTVGALRQALKFGMSLGHNR